MPKANTPTANRGSRRHNPLEDDITASGLLRNKPTKRKSRGDDDETEQNFVDSKASKNILRIGRELAEEDNAETAPNVIAPTIDNFGYDSRFDELEGDEENRAYGDDDGWGDDDEEVVEEIEVDPEDLETYRKFMGSEEDELLKHGWDRRPDGEGEDEEPVNLADLILEKIAAHEANKGRPEPMNAPDDYEIPPKVVEVYTK